ncbi:MAG TPA: glucose-1-phosphate adenylyltransferase [Pirellulaceae bacterium]
MKELLVVVLGGGRGTRLYPLTKYRSKPAVPVAGKYRLIDIPISNCLNSGFLKIYVLTQFLSVSLHRHIRETYRFDAFSGGFVEILAAQQTMDAGTDWYEGTADAVRKNLRYLTQPGIESVLVLSGDQLYRMDYRAMLQTHRASGADVTIAGLPVTKEQASSCGIMRLGEEGLVKGFMEKPQLDEEVQALLLDPAWLRQRGYRGEEPRCLASMGIYLFNRQTLEDVLFKTQYQDFGREIFPAAARSRHVQVHLFDDYWEDIGTIQAFYEANLALCRANAPFDLLDVENPVYTRPRFLPPSRIHQGDIRDSMIADGCQIGTNVTIENSIIGVRSIVGDGVQIRNSVLMGADEYDVGDPAIPLGIGPGSVIEGAIIDKNCRIGAEVRIHNRHRVDTRDLGDICYIRDGIPVLVKDAIVPNGWRVD